MEPQARFWGSLVLLLAVSGHSAASGAVSTIEAKLVLEQESILAGGIVTGFVEFVNRSGPDLVVSNGPYEYSGNRRLTVTGDDGKAVEVGNPDTKSCDYGEDYRAFAAYGGADGVLLYIWSRGRGWPEGRSSEVGFFDDIGVKIEGKQRLAAAAGAGMWMREEIQANWRQLAELPPKDDVKGPINVRIGGLLVY